VDERCFIKVRSKKVGMYKSLRPLVAFGAVDPKDSGFLRKGG
jgi:hypothetical protein